MKQKKEEKEYAYRIYKEGLDIYNGQFVENNSYENALEKGLLEALKLIK